VADTVDPLAGSYFVESLTDEIEHRAELLIEEIEKRGGATAAIEQGFIQERIAESAYRYQQEVERGERVVVGVNKFQDAVEPQLKLLRVDERLEERRRELLSQYREKRDQQAVAKALRLVSETARTEQNLMPVIVAAVRAGATLGEISDALRQVFGEYDRLR
jgi:methylmalonyl-CoA mutase N-terminal domain/subunit